MIMLIKTHLAICLFFVLFFIDKFGYVNDFYGSVIFILVALGACYVPDVDSKFSSLGKRRIFRFLQFFVKHRGIFHSFIFLVILSFFVFVFFYEFVFPFFIGYSTHLLTDSLTLQGVRLFYPFKKKFSWKIKTGGIMERVVFLIFLFLDLFLCIFRFF